MPAFPTTPLLDNFDRSNEGPIGGNWSTPVTQVGFGAQAALSSNGIISQNTPPATVSAYWNIETFLNSEAWIECDADLEATESFVVYARLKDVGTVNWDGYQVALVFDGSFTIARRDNAVSTLLASTTVTASVGDYIGIRCVGSVIQAWHRPVGTGVWVHVLSATDSTYPDAGYIGFGMFTTDLTTKLDNFGGGNVNYFPTTPLLDDFNRADELPIVGNWTSPTFSNESDTELYQNRLGTNPGSAYWDVSTFGPDCEVWIELSVLPNIGGSAALRARIQGVGGLSSASSYYALLIYDDASVRKWKFAKVVSGTFTSLTADQDFPETLTAGDKVGLQCIGTTLKAYWNHATNGWTLLGTITDSSITAAGYIGTDQNESVTHFDNFGGGTYSRYAAEVLTDSPVAYYRMNNSEFEVIASDNFNRANEDPLAGDWTTAVGDGGAMRIVSNVATKNAAVDSNNDGAIYDGVTFPDNQWSAAKLSVTSTNGVRRGPALFVRHAFAANTSYRISVDHAASNNCNISRFLAGTRTTLLDFTQAWTDGAEWKIAVDGPASAARIRIYLNGTLLQTVTDNSSIASGYPGIGVSDSEDVTNVVIDDWHAGEVLLIQDSSGLAHHATTSGGTATYQIPSPNPIETDPNNYFIDFNGTLSYGIPDHTDLDFGDVMTAEAWVISGDWQHGPTHHVISGRGSGALTWYVDYTDNKLTVAKANTGNICKADFVFEEDVWYHCMYTKNGSTSRIYINGVNVTGTVTNQTLVDVSNQLVVGGDYDLTSYRFYGALDEVAFYRTELSRDRAIAHYLAAGGFLLNSFETGLPTSTAITTANSNDDVAGAQWDNLVVTAGGSAVYTTDKSAYGTRSGLFTPVAAGGAHVRWDESSIGLTETEIYGRFYIYRTDNPTPNPQWMTHLGVVGTDHVGVIRWKADGKLELLNNPFSTVGTSTNSIPLNEWVRVEFHVVCHPTTGMLEAKFFHGHETTAIETVTASNTNTSTAVNEINFGQWNAETTGGSFYLDEVALGNTEYIGPATLVVEPQTVYFVRRRSWR
jgi:hypothetical protein